MLALLLGQDLLSVNCHAGTETADFLGSLRPARNHAAALQKFRAEASAFLHRFEATAVLLPSGPHAVDLHATSDAALLQRARDVFGALPEASRQAESEAAVFLHAVDSAFSAAAALFEWVDGPLVSSLRSGSFFLLDECSLAEDAVLERLNSVLEPSRSLTLAEKGSDSSAASVIRAAKGFRFFATMNPGGDFGKRELSPALRNRFTEVWVPPVTDAEDLLHIVRDKAVAVSLFPNRRPSGSALTDALRGEVGGILAGGAICAEESWRRVLVEEFPSHLVEFVLWFDLHASSGRLVLRASPSGPAAGVSNASPATVGDSPVLGSALVTRSRLLMFTLRDLHQWLAFMAELVLRRGFAETSPSGMEDSEQIGADCRDSGVTLWQAYCHAACLVLLDGLGLGTGLPLASCASIREASVMFLLGQAPACEREVLSRIFNAGSTPSPERKVVRTVLTDAALYGIQPFFVTVGPRPRSTELEVPFTFLAPTTRKNLSRVLRALQVGWVRMFSLLHGCPHCPCSLPQLPGPILLEGSPGVGKSSLVDALARESGHTLVRINLSEQSDLADLFGQDLPVVDSDSGDGVKSLFSWADGVLLKVRPGRRGAVGVAALGNAGSSSLCLPPQALKAGHWVLLDELNLATQQVLEGLNSCLDHRASVFIPELGRSFDCPPTFRVFATQNPVAQGGGRRGLPKSFLNRFTKVYVDPLSPEDLTAIGASLFPGLAALRVGSEIAGPSGLNRNLLDVMIEFNASVARGSSAVPGSRASDGMGEFGGFGVKGRPWDFNLRDLTRWCTVVAEAIEPVDGLTAEAAALVAGWSAKDQAVDVLRVASRSLDTLFLQRFRVPSDREKVLSLFSATFGAHAAAGFELHDTPLLRASPRAISVDDVWLPRSSMPGMWSLSHAVEAELPCAVLSSLAPLQEVLVAGCPPLSRDISRAPASCVSPHLTRHIYHLMRAVRHGWPTLLVGRAASAKSAAVQALADLSGATLRQLTVTTSSDATDLLGCYEQSDPSRHLDTLEARLLAFAQAAMLSAARLVAAVSELDGETQATALLQSILADVDHLRVCCQRVNETAHGPPTGVSLRKDAFSAACSAAAGLSTLLCKLATRKGSHDVFEKLKSGIACLARDLDLGAETIVHGMLSPGNSAGRFEWVDGVLVEALVLGHWLLVDNVNLCTPAVVDRLNAVLEPGGALLLGECGIDSAGRTRVVVPHPSFRVFFTVNPDHGEVSRALRNRCVELYFDDAVSSVNASHGAAAPSLTALSSAALRIHALSAIGMEDGVAVLSAGGISDVVVSARMWAVHAACCSSSPTSAAPGVRRGGRPGLGQLRRWAELTTALLCLGSPRSDRPRTCSYRDGLFLAARAAFHVVYWACSPADQSVDAALAPAAETSLTIASEMVPAGICTAVMVDDSSYGLAALHVAAAMWALGGHHSVAPVPEARPLETVARFVLGAANASEALDVALRAQLLCASVAVRWGGVTLGLVQDSTVARVGALLREVSSGLASHSLTPAIVHTSRILTWGITGTSAALPCTMLPGLAGDDAWVTSMLLSPLQSNSIPAVLVAIASALREECVWRDAELRAVESELEQAAAAASALARSASGGASIIVPLAVAAAVAAGTQAAALPSRACAVALPSSALASLVLLLDDIARLLRASHCAAAVAVATSLEAVTESNASRSKLAVAAYRVGIALSPVWLRCASLRRGLLDTDCTVCLSAGSESLGPDRGVVSRLRNWDVNGAAITTAATLLIKDLHTAWCAVKESGLPQTTDMDTLERVVCERLAFVEASLRGSGSGSSSGAVAETAALIGRAAVPADLRRATRWPKDALWKHGGHPQLPTLDAVADMRAELSSMCASLGRRNGSAADATSARRLPPPFATRQLLVDAWSTLNWLVGVCRATGSDDEEHPPPSAPTSQVTLGRRALRVLMDDLAGRLSAGGATELAAYGAPAEGDDLDALVGCDAATMSDDALDSAAKADLLRLLSSTLADDDAARPLRRQESRVAVSPVIEAWCLAVERRVHAAVLRAIAAEAMLPATGPVDDTETGVLAEAAAAAAGLQRWLPRLRVWIAVAIAGTSWASSQVAPYQGILWAIDAAAQGTVRVGPGPSAVEFLRAVQPALQSAFTALLLDWQVRALRRQETAAVAASPGSSGEPLAAAAGVDAASRLTDAAGLALTGPDKTSLRSLDERVYGAFLVAGHVASRGGGDEAALDQGGDESVVLADVLAADEATIALALLVHTCACFLRRKGGDGGLLSLRRWVSAAGGYGPASSSHGASYDLSTATLALVSALKSARDVRLDAIVNHLVVPALAAVASMLSSPRAPAAAAAAASRAALVARAAAAVGALRAHLLLPLHPLDPAERPAAKRRLLVERRDAVSASRAALARTLQALAGGTGAGSHWPPVRRCDEEIARLDAAIRKCERQVVVRGSGEGESDAPEVSERPRQPELRESEDLFFPSYGRREALHRRTMLSRAHFAHSQRLWALRQGWAGYSRGSVTGARLATARPRRGSPLSPPFSARSAVRSRASLTWLRPMRRPSPASMPESRSRSRHGRSAVLRPCRSRSRCWLRSREAAATLRSSRAHLVSFCSLLPECPSQS